jgi:hypothetical protein
MKHVILLKQLTLTTAEPLSSMSKLLILLSKGLATHLIYQVYASYGKLP